ncbi:MAG: DUF58 domain-containing protein [Lachnospiraceae bacterium]|nr:DUF58 domain-containing protein [Lachnospiraceae bacterium]
MRKRNLVYIITYSLAVFLILLGTVFYRQSLLTVLLLLLLLLPVISISATAAALRKLTITVEMHQAEITAPNELRVLFRLKNDSIFPLLNLDFLFTFGNGFFPSLPPQELTLFAEGRRTREYTLPFEVAAAGMFSIHIDEVYATDFLHFYSFRLPFRYSAELPVLPPTLELPPITLGKALIESEDSEPSPDGDLTQDLLEIREYRPGDRLKDIHWKMTAKTDELSVKEYERARDLYFLLLPELEGNFLQRNLSLFFSIGKRLLKEQERYRVAIYHSGDRSFEFLRVGNEEDLLQALYRLYLEPSERISTAYESLSEQYPDMQGVIRIHGGQILSSELSGAA